MIGGSFTEKRLQFMLVLDSDTFDTKDGDKKNTVVLEGYRASVTIDLAGLELGQGHMACRIWGVPKALMDKIDTMGDRTQVGGVKPMAVKVAADDGTGQFVDVFEGHVISARPDYNAAPNVPIEIQAMSGYLHLWDAPKANSYKGEFEVAKAIEGLAKSMKFAFENKGVNVKLCDQYVSGSTMNQIRTLACAAKIACMIQNRKVMIWPEGKNNGQPVLKLSPQTGLIGYPRWELNGVTVTHQFNQNIQRGTEVELETSIPALQGQWFIQLPIRHMLDAEMPGGKWHTEAFMTRGAEGYVRKN